MMKVPTPRTIIFCQTRKQCALLYHVFSLSLGQALYSNEQLAPESCYVEMFHAGTPESVKSHVTQQMADANSHLCVLICTIAFGMGVDYKEIYRSIHFGPSKSLESLIQECGRIGRDGNNSLAYILYNGFLTSCCSTKIKQLIQNTGCYRKEMGKSFASFSNTNLPNDCRCCDRCLPNCDCGPDCVKCCLSFNLFANCDEGIDIGLRTTCVRKVTESQKELLLVKLKALRAKLLSAFASDIKIVGSPLLLFEFDNFQISQLMDHC